MPEDNLEIAQEITEYLDYYCNAVNKFDLAVMLKGPWGAGKTNFIRKYIERDDGTHNPDRFMYLSLYGVQATSQVDDEIFRQLHPFLASKTVKFGTQIMKGLLRGAVKIDLDQHDHASIAMQTPSIELKEFLKRTTDRVLVFDDLERCSMKVADILGYINAFVEHQAQKVIIMANEDELIERENNSKKSGKEVVDARYSDIKEKIVGRTLEIRSSVSSVLPEFISGVRDDKVRTLLDSSKKDVEAIFLQSERHNFRLLKQALWDFEFLSNSFEERHWTRHEVLQTIMLVLVALSFECRSGRLNRENFSEFGLNWLTRAARQNKGEETILDKIQARYPGVDFGQTFVGSSELATLLFEGRVEAKAIRDSLNRSAPFAERALVPAWKRVTVFSTDPKNFDSAVSELGPVFS